MRRHWVVILALAAASFAGGGMLARATRQPYLRDESDAARAFRQAVATIEENHVSEPEGDALYRDATRGLLASLDDPSRYRPKHHFGVESLHRFWINTEGLPEYRTDEYQPLVDRWVNAVGKLPD
jgi:hypothetical protein